MWLFIVIIALLIISFVIMRKSKKLRLPNFTLITGALKTGKTCLCVHLALKKYKSILLRWKINTFFKKLLKKTPSEKPLLYSNIKLGGIDYVPFTKDLLLRNKRFAYGSVCILSESALVADSQNYKDIATNETLTYFCKLFAHETRGGYLFSDTQNITDLHYSFKRVNNTYLWIKSNIKIPFFMIMFVREMVYNAENNAINTFETDTDDTLKWLLIPKKVWKQYDRYCYSIFTDNLEVATDTEFNKLGSNLKTDTILQVKESKYLKGGSYDKK